MLLEQRNQEIDGQMDVLDKLIFVHVHVANGDAQAQNLFHLELDGGLQFVTLLIDVVSVGEERREFSGLVETRTQEPWNLLNKRLGSQKGVVFLGELLNKLFLLVQLFQVISAHERVAFVFSLIAMLLISKDTHREFGPWNVAQLNGARETLILLGIVVLQTNLEVDSLDKLPWLGLLGIFNDLANSVIEGLLGYLASPK